MRNCAMIVIPEFCRLYILMHDEINQLFTKTCPLRSVAAFDITNFERLINSTNTT
jgi:hypothetical protein